MNIEMLANLKNASALDSDDDFRTYTETCSEIRRSADRPPLPKLLECLNDKEGGEIQYELIELCESYPDDDYCESLMVFCEDGYFRSPFWFDLMFCSMLNSQNLFDRILALAKNNHFATRKIEELVSNDEVDPEFSAQWKEARQPWH